MCKDFISLQGSSRWDDKYRVGVAMVSVKILDVNDNSPVFGKNKQVTSVKEDAPLGTIVTQAAATDKDGVCY